jgi:hypothetical protein
MYGGVSECVSRSQTNCQRFPRSQIAIRATLLAWLLKFTSVGLKLLQISSFPVGYFLSLLFPSFAHSATMNLSASMDVNCSAEIGSVTSDSSCTASSVATDHKQQRDTQKVREMTVLPKDFVPAETDVIIGRGKLARTHDGNQRLRGLIEFMIPEYSSAGSNKDEKSYIIKEIVTQIRKSSPDGGFVKFDKHNDRWFEVGDFL